MENIHHFVEQPYTAFMPGELRYKMIRYIHGTPLIAQFAQSIPALFGPACRPWLTPVPKRAGIHWLDALHHWFVAS